MFEKLETTFDLIPADTGMPLPAVVPPYSEGPADAEEDQDLVESTLEQLISKSMGSLDDLVDVAKASEHPRAYEATATLVQTIAEVVSKLDAVKQRKQKTTDASPESAGTVNQNLFVGSTEDVLELLEKLDSRRKN